MLISPIMMVPSALPSALIQQEYLENVEEMSIRVGMSAPFFMASGSPSLYF
jgi:hypothetical protein